jgi:hypothetical protein
MDATSLNPVGSRGTRYLLILILDFDKASDLIGMDYSF